MPDLTPEQYQKEYDEATAALDKAAEGKPEAITETAPAIVETIAPPAPEKAPEIVVAEPAKPAADAQTDPLEELRAKLEKTEKALKDTQAWGTKNSQRLAEIEREREKQQREATRPAILDENPELADAIRYVASDPAPKNEAQQRQDAWKSTVEAAHPGIFDVSIDKELETALMTRLGALGDAVHDPLVAIREITAEKIAFTERQVSKRFAIESAKLAEKSAMSVPGAGGGGAARQVIDPDAAAVQRINSMSDAEFAKEVRRAKGF